MTLLLLQIEMKTVRPLVYLIAPGKLRSRPIYIGANRLLSKLDPEGVLYYTKVLPWETSPQYPKPPSLISQLNKTAGQRYIDTPGAVYLEVFVDSPQGCIVLSSSFAGAAVQKTKGPADT